MAPSGQSRQLVRRGSDSTGETTAAETLARIARWLESVRNEGSRSEIVTSAHSPGASIAFGTAIATGGGAEFAVSAMTVCQKRSNADTDRSRNRQASSAPLTTSRPAPTDERHTTGRLVAVSVDVGSVPAIGSAPAGREDGQAISDARSPPLSFVTGAIGMLWLVLRVC